MSDASIMRGLRARIDDLEAQVAERDRRIEALIGDADCGPVALPWRMSPAERRLLFALAKAGAAGVEQSRAQVIVSPYGHAGSNVLAARLSTLRKTLRPDGIEIETRYTIGYAIAEGLDKVRAAFGMEAA